MLDLKHINLADKNVASFALKRDAIAFAKAQGWQIKDAIKAFNRFNIFYVVGQSIGTSHYNILRRDGTVLDLSTV